MEDQIVMCYYILFDEVPFLQDLRVGFHQVIRDVITCQILEDVSSHPFHLKDNNQIKTQATVYFTQ